VTSAGGSAWATVAEQTRRNPLAAGAAAFAAGWLVGRLLLPRGR